MSHHSDHKNHSGKKQEFYTPAKDSSVAKKLKERFKANNKIKDDEKEVQVPMGLPAYDKNYFWKINWKALPTDLVFILFGIVLSRGYFDEPHAINSLSPKIILGLFMVVVIAVCWYIGFIMARYKSFYPLLVNQIARVIFCVVGITLLGYLMAIILTPSLLLENHTDKTGSNMAMWATFLMVLGPIVGVGGFMTGGEILKCEVSGKKYDGGADQAFYAGFFMLLVTCGALVVLTQTDFVQNSSVTGLWIALCMIGACMIGMASLGILVGLKWVLEKIKLYYQLAFVFETIFPCIIIASLIFWNEIQRHYLGDVSTGMRFGALFFTGIIPFRMILIFNPPLRAVNLFVGIASFIFYMWSIAS